MLGLDLLFGRSGSGSSALANFTADDTSVDTATAVTFSYTGGGSVDAYLWDFGDGNSSTSASPSHTYAVTGSYTVTLTVVLAAGAGTKSKMRRNYIAVWTPAAGAVTPEAWLTSGPTWQFTDASAVVPITAGDLVRRWLDRSGNGHHLSQATAANRPTGVNETEAGGWTLFFGPASDRLLFDTPWPQAYPLYVYARVRPVTADGYQMLLENSDYTHGPFLYLQATGFAQVAGVTPTATGPSIAPLIREQDVVFRFRVSATDAGVRVDRAAEALTACTPDGSVNWLAVGDDLFGQDLQGYLRELLIYQGSAIDPTLDSQILTYLGQPATPAAYPYSTSGSIAGDAWELHPAANRDPSAPLVIYCHLAGGNEASVYGSPPYPHRSAINELRVAGYAVAAGYFQNDAWGNQTALDRVSALYSLLTGGTRETPSRVILLGESMGGLTALLCLADPRFAAVKGAYLWMPVCNLRNMFDSTPAFKESIRAAYGIALDYSDYGSLTAGHDPVLLSASLFDGKRLRFTASPDDTTVTKVDNTDMMRTLVTGHATELGLVVASGVHGDISHYPDQDLVDFCNRCV